MDVSFEPPRIQTEEPSPSIQQKLADARYFFLSLTIHIILVICAAYIIITKVMETPDFVAEGGDGLLSKTEDLPPAAEQPQESSPSEPTESQAPTLEAPTLDVISTTNTNNAFKVVSNSTKINVSNAMDLAKTVSKASGPAGISGNGLPGTMKGRSGSGRSAAMARNKMKSATELAVLRGLEWLRLNQNADGSWGSASGGDSSNSGMTGLALLCFLGHGETNTSEQYGLTVNKAVQWIIDKGTAAQGRLSMEGGFTQNGVYAHGILTYALGEYFTMSKDERCTELLKQAINHIIQGQGPVGGWAYGFSKSENDLSVSGWQIQALKAAHLSQLNIPGVDEALDKAMSYLQSVKGPQGGYGYRGPEDRYSLSGVGILCRLFWKGDRADLRAGMQWILNKASEKDKAKPLQYKGADSDIYAWYYHTQAALMFGGEAWDQWNKWFQDEIVGAQNPDGSWPAPGGGHGPVKEESLTGKTYRTTLCILMLEVFYRYMPSHAL